MLQGAFGIEVKGYGEGVLVLAGPEGRRLGQGSWEKGQPLTTHTERLALVAQPEVEGRAQAHPLSYGRAVDPKGPAPFPLFQADGHPARGLLARPPLHQQRWLGGEVGAVLGG